MYFIFIYIVFIFVSRICLAVVILILPYFLALQTPCNVRFCAVFFFLHLIHSIKEHAYEVSNKKQVPHVKHQTVKNQKYEVNIQLNGLSAKIK